jgi:TM2 domain-containing membrane protein YozV
MKKILTQFLGLLAAGSLLNSCSSEKLVASGNYSKLAIAQQSPTSEHVPKLLPASLAFETNRVCVFSASLEKQPALIEKQATPQNKVETSGSSGISYKAKHSNQGKLTQSIKPNHKLKTATVTSGKESPSGNRNWLAALLFAFFLGAFGIHRFYLGYTTIGIIQLLMTVIGTVLSLFIIGIPILIAVSIWVLVDLIRIAVGELKPKNGEYDFLWFRSETPAPQNNNEI